MKTPVHDIKCECGVKKKITNKGKPFKGLKGCKHSWIETPETCVDCKQETLNNMQIIPNSFRPTGSKCCKAPLKLSSGEEGTNFYLCSKCHIATDMVFLDKEKEEPEGEEIDYASKLNLQGKITEVHAKEINDFIISEKEKSYTEGKKEALNLIATDNGWEESREMYAEKLGLKDKQ